MNETNYLLITDGEYSDYHVTCLLVIDGPVDIDKMRRDYLEYLTAQEPDDSWLQPRPAWGRGKREDFRTFDFDDWIATYPGVQSVAYIELQGGGMWEVAGKKESSWFYEKDESETVSTTVEKVEPTIIKAWIQVRDTDEDD